MQFRDLIFAGHVRGRDGILYFVSCHDNRPLLNSRTVCVSAVWQEEAELDLQEDYS